MNQQAEQSIIEMMNGFSQTSQDYRLLLVTLARQCAGLTDRAIIEAADRFGAGDVAGQSKKFAPSVPEFVEEARNRQEFIDLASRHRLPAPVYRGGSMAPFEVKRQQALAKYADHPVLLENVTHEQWRRLSASRQVPAGATWVACLGVVYGPASKSAAQAA